jgi:phosphatidylinositol glycan class S
LFSQSNKPLLCKGLEANALDVSSKCRIEMGETSGTEVLSDASTRNAMDKPTDVVATQAKKEPPPEKAEAVRIRSFVVWSFWVVILLLGFPMWWQTTSIYRARLPLQEMMEWADGKVLP